MCVCVCVCVCARKFLCEAVNKPSKHALVCPHQLRLDLDALLTLREMVEGSWLK